MNQMSKLINVYKGGSHAHGYCGIASKYPYDFCSFFYEIIS